MEILSNHEYLRFKEIVLLMLLIIGKLYYYNH